MITRHTALRRAFLGLYLVSVALVTVQQGVLKQANNFAVFRTASLNLFAGLDLYAAHPEQHFDYYKYSPTFAFLFAPLAVLPFALALLLWNLLNAMLLYYALAHLLPERRATLALALVYVEVLFAMQYSQSNALVTALIVLGFLALERGRQLSASLAIALGACVKIFPVAALALGTFHPRKWRFGLVFLGVAVGLLALPLVAVPPHELLAQYRSWQAIEAADTLNRGYSVMEYLYLWFGLDWPNWPVQLAGTAVFLLPVALGPSRWADPDFRRLFLCSLLVYLVLFNHQSERATFVIAYTGIVVWYASSPRTRLRTALMAFAFFVMAVHSLDIVPRSVKNEIFIPYRLKGIPCLIAWVVIQLELWRWGRRVRLESAEVD